MQSFGMSKIGKPYEVFPSLLPLFNEKNEEKSMGKKLKNSSVLEFLKKAIGGEKIDTD